MKQRQIFIALVMLFVVAVLVSSVPQVEAAKKVQLFPYKIVFVNGKTGDGPDSVIWPLDNLEANPVLKGTRGHYRVYFDPAEGDSATYAVDSTQGRSDTTSGLHYDTVEIFFDVLDYDGGWLGWGLEAWDSNAANADADSHMIQFEVHLGTELGTWGDFYPLRALAVSDRGLETFPIDTIVCCMESLYVNPLENNVTGGVDVDSTLFLDKLRMRYVIVDSALVGDAVNAREVYFRAFMLVKEEY